MAGIYLHIPFCSKACHYCNFHFSTSLHRLPEVLQALEAEIIQPWWPPDYVPQRRIDSIYFGGGTPSLLSPAQLGILLQRMREQYEVAPTAEITLEANPDDVSPQRLEAWLQLGINRLSMGVQSFFDDDLRWMNRAHDARQALNSLSLLRTAGFQNFSIDLIYGLPGTTHQRWLQNLHLAMEAQVPHLSCYALTVEPRTALDVMIKRQKARAPDDAVQQQQLDLLMDTAATYGYDHYEISNLALPGLHSRHNSSYWQGLPYYGFGPSAHSYDGQHTRWWNVANNSLYLQWAQQPHLRIQHEVLSPVQQLNEAIMTGLRTSQGITLQPAQLLVAGRLYPAAQWPALQQTLQQALQQGWIANLPDRIQLTRRGRHFADRLAADLFAEE
jgi:oxygen-independent coproporphyrinogen-3 oxidase